MLGHPETTEDQVSAPAGTLCISSSCQIKQDEQMVFSERKHDSGER